MWDWVFPSLCCGVWRNRPIRRSGGCAGGVFCGCRRPRLPGGLPKRMKPIAPVTASCTHKRGYVAGFWYTAGSPLRRFSAASQVPAATLAALCGESGAGPLAAERNMSSPGAKVRAFLLARSVESVCANVATIKRLGWLAAPPRPEGKALLEKVWIRDVATVSAGRQSAQLRWETLEGCFAAVGALPAIIVSGTTGG